MKKDGFPNPAQIIYEDDLIDNGGLWKLQSRRAIKVFGVEDPATIRDFFPPISVYAIRDSDLKEQGGNFEIKAGTPIPMVRIEQDAAISSGTRVAIPVYPVDANGNYDPSFALLGGWGSGLWGRFPWGIG
jgi:hypothetical protein